MNNLEEQIRQINKACNSRMSPFELSDALIHIGCMESMSEPDPSDLADIIAKFAKMEADSKKVKVVKKVTIEMRLTSEEILKIVSEYAEGGVKNVTGLTKRLSLTQRNLDDINDTPF